MIASSAADLRRYPASAEAFLNDGLPPNAPWGIKGETRLPQEKLKATLSHLAAAGRFRRDAHRPQRLGRGSAGDLFDLRPTEDQAMLQEAARSFALERFRPGAAAADSAYAPPDHLLSEGTELGVTDIGTLSC